MPKNKPWVFSKVPKTVNIMDKLPYLGGKAKAVPVEQFIDKAQKTGNEIQAWSEQYDFGEDYKEPSMVIPNNKKADLHYNFEKKQAQKNLAKMALVYMNEKTGWGVVAAEELLANECIGFYTGQYDSPPSAQRNPYYFTLSGLENGTHVGIDAKAKGNITRFFQHAYSKASHDLNSFKINNSELATANVEAKAWVYKNKAIASFYTLEKIPQGHMVFLNYTQIYWLAVGTSPYFFDRMGRLMDSPKDYEVTQYEVFFVLPKSNLGPIKSRQTFSKHDLVYKLETHASRIMSENLSITYSEKSLREQYNKKPSSSILTVPALTAGFEDRVYQEYVILHLKRLTTLTWKYNHGEKKAFANLDKKAVALLKTHDFNLTEGVAASPKLLGQKIMVLDLQLRDDLERLAEIKPTVVPEKKPLTLKPGLDH